MKRLRSSSDDLDSYNDKNVDGESLNSDRPASSSHRGFFHKSFSARRGPISPTRYDRDRQPFVDDAGFSRALSRRRSSRDFDDNPRKEPDVRYREDRLHRSESACFSRRAFPKGFRSERERPKREASVSSWRRFGGPGNDFDRERGALALRFRDGERERSVKSPTWSDVDGERNIDMEEDMDLTEDDFGNASGQFVGETSIVDAVNVSVDTVKVDVSSKTGVKRARTTSDEQQPSVHVTYKHLTRASKQKLESLLQQWSEWEAEQNSLSQDQEQVLESGDETYFPALRVGLQKTSSVSFWFDYQTGRNSLKEFVPVESSTTPLYNRGFTIGLDSANGSSNLEGGLEIIDDPPRCFNCGGYSHSIRECPKPFDRAAVSIARRQHKSKRNQTPGSRLPSRYYQSAQGGKYDGLKPGSLDAETRQLLGLGELDPPPWLHRMREIGYPPGYLAVEDDHLSGITIFGEEETKAEEEVKTEDGEILETASPQEPQMKKTVVFPAINAPIPENASPQEGELEPEPQLEAASGAAHTTHDSEESEDHPPCAADDHKNERVDSSFQEIKRNAEFETESIREVSHVGSDREMKTAEGMMDMKSVEKEENVPEHATESMPTSQNNVNDTSTTLAGEQSKNDKGDKGEEYKVNHEVKLEESLYPAVPERFQAEELKRVKGNDGDANKAEVEAPICVEENALGNKSSAKYISIVSDSSIHKCEDKGRNLDVPLTHLHGKAVLSEGKFEDLTDRDKDEDDNFGGPSIRGFELFSSSPVRKTSKTEQSGVNKPKDEKLLLEPLDLSLSLPDVLLPTGGQDTNQPLGSPARSGSVRSLTDTFCTNSDGFTMSMSFSGSRSFNHNPSCSLNQNIGDNEQSVHSRPIFQGIDWQALSHNDSRYNENTVYQRLMENGNGSAHPRAMKGVLIPGQADEEHLRLTDGSSKAANRLEKQMSFQKSVDVRSACPRTGSLENDSKFHVEKKKAKDFFGGSISWISGQEAGGDDSVETVVKYILSDSMHVMTKRFHEMPTRYITSLKENIRQIMLNMDKNVQLSAFQDALQNRSDITLELLTKSHRAQLEILVALKTGRSDFLQLDNSISSTHLAEIYMNMRCKNLSCRVLVPVDECDCRVCSRKDGFCSACMCLVCSNFDMASNTCSWVGCDVCLHWCHTDCGIRESYVRNGINASGAPGMTEMQFHCVACDHPSEMFGFVKEVFLNFAREWKFERFCKELEYVNKIFSSSKDFRGKQLRQAADAMLARLKSKSIDLPEACNRILGFISDCDSSTPGETLRYEQPKPKHERGSPSQDTAWLRSEPQHQLKRSASEVGAFHRGEICGVETGTKRGSPRFEELESIVRMKQAEAEMFQGRADDARREADGLKRIAVAKKEKIEEEYKRRMGKLSVEEAEEKRRRRQEELEAMERGQREFYEMKMRMEEEMRGLLTKMEVTKQSLAF